jgi:hypothetical protein
MEPHKDQADHQQPFHMPGQQFAPAGDAKPSETQATSPAETSSTSSGSNGLGAAPVSMPASPVTSIPVTDSASVPPASPTVTPDPVPQPTTSAVPTPSAPAGPAFMQPTPPTPTGPVVSNHDLPGGPTPMAPLPTTKPRKKKLILAISTVAAVLLLAGGAVFGWYIPNKPENVFKTGLDHTGQAIDGLIQEATKQEKLQALATSQLTGSFKANYGSNGKFSGTINSWQSATDSDSGIEVAYTGADKIERKVNLKVLTEVAKGNQYPDVFFQVTGLQALGADALVPGIGDYEGKWIYLSNSYIKSIADKTDSKSSKESVTSADVAALTRDLSATTRDYVFTADTEKGILVNQKFVGKEKVDGIKTNHYVVAINKENMKKYCQVLGDTVAKSAAFKKLIADEGDRVQRMDEFVNSCKDSTDNLDKKDTFDIWVGGKYRTIQRARFVDENDSKIYTDIGQHYEGGDVFELYSTYHDGTAKTDGTFTVKTNVKSSVTTGKLTMTSKSEDNPWDVTADFELKPHSGKATITKPKKYIDFQDLIKQWEQQAAAAQQQALEQARQAQLEADRINNRATVN